MDIFGIISIVRSLLAHIISKRYKLVTIVQRYMKFQSITNFVSEDTLVAKSWSNGAVPLAHIVPYRKLGEYMLGMGKSSRLAWYLHKVEVFYSNIYLEDLQGYWTD